MYNTKITFYAKREIYHPTPLHYEQSPTLQLDNVIFLRLI